MMDHYGNAVSFYPVFLFPPFDVIFLSRVFAVGSFFTPGEETRSCVFLFLFLEIPKSKFPNSPTKFKSYGFTRHIVRKRNGAMISTVDPTQPPWPLRGVLVWVRLSVGGLRSGYMARLNQRLRLSRHYISRKKKKKGYSVPSQVRLSIHSRPRSLNRLRDWLAMRWSWEG